MVGGLAATVGLDDFHLGTPGKVELALLGATAQRDHRWMLEQDDCLGDRPLRDGGGEGALELPRLAVGREAEVQEVRAARHGAQPSPK